MARKKAQAEAVLADEQVISQLDRQIKAMSRYARPAGYLGAAAVAAMLLGLILSNMAVSDRREASNLLGQGIKSLQNDGLLAGTPATTTGASRVPEALRTLRSEHAGTDVEALGALFQGHYHYQAREWTSAIDAYQVSADRLQKTAPELGLLATYNLALAYESNERWQDALECYSRMEQNKAAMAAFPSALFASGKARVLARLDRADEGRSLLKSAMTGAGDEMEKKALEEALQALSLPAPATPPAEEVMIEDNPATEPEAGE